jgi:hypothetical protein
MIHVLKVERIGFTGKVKISSRDGTINHETQVENIKTLGNRTHVYIGAIVEEDLQMRLVDEISEKDIITW